MTLLNTNQVGGPILEPGFLKDAHPHRLIVLQHFFEVASQVCFGIDRRIECVPCFGLHPACRLQNFGETTQVATSAQESDKEEDDYSDCAAANPNIPNAGAGSPASPTTIDHLSRAGGISLEFDHVANLPRTGLIQPLRP